MGENKRNITRENLQLHGIFYVEEVYSGDDEQSRDGSCALPNHVDAVREMLLNFEGIIPEDWRQDLDDEFKEHGSNNLDPSLSLQPPPSAFFRPKNNEISEPGPELKAVRERLRKQERTAGKARHLHRDAEPGWAHFWRSDVFKIFEMKHGTQHRQDALLDKWSLEEDFLWNEFPNFEPPNQLPEGRTQPRPDLAYAFPILEARSERPKGLERDEFTRCFSLEFLGELRKNEIFSSPATGLLQWTKFPDKKLWTTACSCFPWAVVEFKKNDNSTERCYCQAANAAAAALTLHAQLIEKSFGDSLLPVPPVIAFTTVGPIVKVWLAYQTSDISGRKQQRMVCIWSTSVWVTWGVTALHAILKNMHVWAARILKPKISACIFQAHAKLALSIPSEPNTPTSRKPKTSPARKAKNLSPIPTKPISPNMGKSETITSQCTAIDLFNLWRVNNPSPSRHTPSVLYSPTLQSAGPSPISRPLNRSPLLPRTEAHFSFGKSSTVAQPVERVRPFASPPSILFSSSSRASTPKLQKSIAPINSPAVSLDNSVLKDNEGKAHNGAQTVSNELSRLFRSIELEDPSSKEKDGSGKSTSNEPDGDNSLKPGIFPTGTTSTPHTTKFFRETWAEIFKDSSWVFSIETKDAPPGGSVSAERTNPFAKSTESVRVIGDGLDARDQSGKNSGSDSKFVNITGDPFRSSGIGSDAESGERLSSTSEYEPEDESEDSEDEGKSENESAEHESQDESDQDESQDEFNIDKSEYDYDEDENEGDSEKGESEENVDEDEIEDDANDTKSKGDAKRIRKHEQGRGESQSPQPPTDVSEENIKRWWIFSYLPALSGKQIAELPFMSELFWQGTTAEQMKWMSTVQEELENRREDFYDARGDSEVLGKLLAHLNLFTKPGISISMDAFKNGEANALIQCAMRSLQNCSSRSHQAWHCLKYALCCWTGSKCLKILSTGLTEEDKRCLERDALALLSRQKAALGERR